MKLTWNGPHIKERMETATLAAINECTTAAAADAKGNHWWRNRSDTLQGDIIIKPAERQGEHRVGWFGSSFRREAFYGLFLERKRPFLRPAADREFPKLGRTIRKHFVGSFFGG
jgi:hypothetical protein